MTEYFIICPFAFLAGLVDAIAGGGGFISLPAYLMAGLPPHAAVATNKFSACLGTFAATVRFAQKGFIDLRTIAVPLITALAGSWLGAELALMIPSDIFRTAMVIVIPLTAVIVLRTRNLDSIGPRLSPLKTAVITPLLTLAVGIYDGMYGPGTGTFLFLLFLYVARFGLNEAAGATKAVNLTTNVSALVIYILNGSVVMPLAAVAAVFAIAGNYIGANFFISKGNVIVKPAIIAVLVIFLVKIGLEYSGIITT